MANTRRADMRLDDETDWFLGKLAKHLGVNRTSVIKIAIRELAREKGIVQKENNMELVFNSQTGNYEAEVEGGTLVVEGDFFSESYPGDELEAHPEALSVETWLNCENGEEVRIERA